MSATCQRFSSWSLRRILAAGTGLVVAARCPLAIRHGDRPVHSVIALFIPSTRVQQPADHLPVGDFLQVLPWAAPQPLE